MQKKKPVTEHAGLAQLQTRSRSREGGRHRPKSDQCHENATRKSKRTLVTSATMYSITISSMSWRDAGDGVSESPNPNIIPRTTRHRTASLHEKRVGWVRTSSTKSQRLATIRARSAPTAPGERTAQQGKQPTNHSTQLAKPAGAAKAAVAHTAKSIRGSALANTHTGGPHVTRRTEDKAHAAYVR